MPIQAPQWTDYLNCPVCCREFGAPPRSPISLSCGHTLCKHCIKHLHRKQCPFDQTVIQVEPDELVINTALLQLAGFTPPSQPYHAPSILALSEQDRRAYDVIVRCMEHLAVYLKYCGTANSSVAGSRLSRPMQRKLVTLLQCPIMDEEGRGKAARAARSLGERTLTELLLQHQNPQQLSANLWAAVRARGCQFLGPAMQEEVLKLVLLALEDGSALSRKVLVMFVVQRLEPHFPQASKTSIGHVVQLLYRASCFKVSKRECNSSLMQLKEEFRTYDSLRREHDAQIVQIATEAGLRIAPDQWSALLYGDTVHKSHMQSIIDKLQSPQTFAQSVQELYIALQRTGDPAQLVVMSMHLDRLASIDSSPDIKCPSWQKLAEIMTSLKDVVTGLVHYLQQQNTVRDANHNQKFNVEPSTSQTLPIATLPSHRNFEKFDVPHCCDAVKRTMCPQGTNCPLIHTDDNLEPYKVVLVESRKMDQHQNGLQNSSNMANGVPSIVVTPPSPERVNHNIQNNLPQFISPFLTENNPQLSHYYRARSQNVHPGRGMYRWNFDRSAFQEMPNVINYVGYFPRPRALYTAPTMGVNRYNVPASPSMQYYFTDQTPVLFTNPDTLDISTNQDTNAYSQFENSAMTGANFVPQNESFQHSNIPRVQTAPHMYTSGNQMFQFQDVPENANVMLETPSYDPMAINLNPEARFAPWSPANRNNTGNFHLNEDKRMVGLNTNKITDPRSEDESHSEDEDDEEDENLTDGSKVVGSNRTAKANARSQDEELEEELVALENYLTNEYKLGD